MLFFKKYNVCNIFIGIVISIIVQIFPLLAQEPADSIISEPIVTDSLLVIDTIVYPPDILDLLEKGDGFFDQRFYGKAARYYLLAFQKMGDDQIISLKIADAFRLNQQYIEAEKYYAIALEEREYGSPMPYFDYADVLLRNEKRKKAQKWFEYYNNLIGNNSPIAKNFIRSIENLERYYVDSVYCAARLLDISSEESDFSPTIYKNGIIFVSSRKGGEKEIGKRYYDLYYSELDTNNIFNTPIRLNRHINTKYHEGPLVFYNNDSQLLLTRSNHSEKKDLENEEMNLSIYSSSIKDLDSEFKDLAKIKIENFDFSMGHPAISLDGKKMLFVSNAEDSYGNTDIYCTTFKNGKWTFPKNLGDKINTAGNEMFLFLQHDSILYFASDGHGGLGGLDIFRVNIAQKDAEIENLGYPINSNKDDFGLIYSKDIKKGYFSSNRSGGVGSDDIYAFEVRKIRFRPTFKSKKTGELLEDIDVSLMDIDDSTMINRNPAREYLEYCLDFDKEYSMTISGDRYKEQSKVISTAVDHYTDILEPLVTSFELIVNPDFDVNFRVQIAASRVPMTEKMLKQRYKGNLPIIMFQEDGWYKYIIGEYYSYYVAKQVMKASGVKDAFIAAYENEVHKLPLKKAIIQKHVTPFKSNKNNRLDKNQVTIKDIFRIHFRFDQINISNKAKIVLDSVVDIMKDDEKCRLEISGHSDIVGNFDYNMALSRERKNEVYDYISNQGIVDKRIKTSCYGESKLLKYCRKNCSKETHKLNRRVELIIYNINK